ncbi:ABC transporter permease [Nocardioides sp. Y6]|uniref:ABC transporter permease n=1 Tax=Nocardioides malaquae TaxID=2773426 RepID=A0ABR9RTW0_9ACTN|nr:ABC transporter permease [Nocardioides malaquae]MBE7324602.1 ABC transporter permease [Nocardioides malaquae]
MRTVLLASLRHHTRRYVASALAVIIGVAFIVTTEGLAGALRDGMTADVGKPYAGVDHVVHTDSEQVGALLAAADRGGFAAEPAAMTWETLRHDGRTHDVTVATAARHPDLRWQELLEGRHPTGRGEALVDERVVAAEVLAVGDEVVIGHGEAAVTTTVVGVAAAAVGVSSDLYLPWQDLSRLQPWVDAVLWNGPPDVATEVVGDAGAVSTADEYVAELQSRITQGVDVIALLVSFFAAIALGVAVLVIANTFAILFAQRARDFALLRCVGVTRRQLRRSIRLEALALGVVSSVLGVALGVGLSVVAAILVGARWEELGQASFRWWWIAAAMVFGVLVSIVAAWLPTRAATRVSPLAALRPLGGFDARSGAGRLRLLLGVLLLAGGGVLLAQAAERSTEGVELARMVAGGGVFFAGVLLLGPVVVPALVRLLGRLAGWGRGASVVRLATSNATRNPRRTATATASLMVGVTLTVAMLTGLGVISAAIDADNDASHPVDAIMVADGRAPYDDAVVAGVEQLGEVAEAVALPGVLATVGGQRVPVVGIGAGATDGAVVRDDDFDPFGDSEAVVSHLVVDAMAPRAQERYYETGLLSVTVDGTVHRVRAASDNSYGPGLLVPEETLAEWTDAPETRAVWVRAVDDADAGDLETGLARVGAEVGSSLVVGFAERAWVETQMKVLTGAALGLLSVGVVIALIGIVNTLGLSVLERTRENALLRAMGLTRSQLRRVLAVEGALLAGVASLLGVAVGLLFAWVGVKVMVVGLVEHSFAVPVPALLAILAAAGVLGTAASVLPARQATRVSPAAGLTAD